MNTRERPPVGTQGIYLAKEGQKNLRHEKPCRVIGYISVRMFLRFDDEALGTTPANKGEFVPENGVNI